MKTLKVILVISILALIMCAHMLFRNQWVYNNRVRFIGDGTDRYDKLPSYDNMMYKRPFCYDIDVFLNQGVGVADSLQ